jgi:hypothetical protein
MRRSIEVEKTYDRERDSDLLRQVVRQYYDRADSLAKWLTDRSMRLAADFRTERMALQAAAREDLAATAAGAYRVRKLYSPIGLFARYHKDALEVFWQKVHYTRAESKPKFYYVKRNRRGDYPLQALSALAKPYEQDLVIRTETEAAVIRARWRAVVALRRVIRQLESTLA